MMLFVTGFPRSRTTWTAVALGMAGVRCGHESGDTLLGFLERVSITDAVAESSCLLPTYYEDIHSFFRGHYRWIHITRSRGEVEESLKKRGSYDSSTPGLLDEIELGLWHWRKVKPPTEIRFEDLSNPETHELICAVAGIGYDRELWSFASTLRINHV